MSRVKITLWVGFLLSVSSIFANDSHLELPQDNLFIDLNESLYTRFKKSYESLLTVVGAFSEVTITAENLKYIMTEVVCLFKSKDTAIILYARTPDENLNSHDTTYSATHFELRANIDEYLENMEKIYGSAMPAFYKSLMKLSKNLSLHIRSKIQIINHIWSNESVRLRIIKDFESQPIQLKALQDLLMSHRDISDVEVFEIQRSSVAGLLGEKFISDLEFDEDMLIRIARLTKTAEAF